MNSFDFVTKEMSSESERAGVFREDGDDVVGKLVPVGRNVTVHIVLHRAREVIDSEMLSALLRCLVKTGSKIRNFVSLLGENATRNDQTTENL